MKPLIRIVVFLIVLSCSFFIHNKAFAIGSNETTITVANLNNKNYFDVEIMQIENNKILLPIKQLADILQIPLKINHSNKELTFNDIKITKTDVYKNGGKINSSKNVYLKKGLMDDIVDEIFCDEKMLSEIFNAKIRVDNADLSVLIQTDNVLYADETEEEIKDEEKPFKAYTDILMPKERKKLTLDTIQFDNSTMSDAAAQIYQNSKNKSYMFSNNSRVTLKGGAYGGDYQMDFATNNYQGKLLNFNGLGFKYSNKYKKTHYEIGKLTGFKDKNYQLGTQILGVQIFDYNPKKLEYREISGIVDEKSIVNVYVNNEYHSTLNTYRGNYSLSDIFFKEEPRKIEIEEMMEDGTKQIVLTKFFSKYGAENEGILEGEKKRSFFVGISGFGNRLFSQNGYLYEMNSKKFTAGARYQYAMRENLFSETKILTDRIISKSESAIWGQNFYNNNSILSMGTYKNPNTMQGFTALNSINYHLNDNLCLSSVFGISQAQDIVINSDLTGYTFALNADYKKENYNLNFGVYNQSPNFYLAGAEYGFISDRIGARIGGGYNYKDWSLNGSYNKYYSNLEKKYGATITDFDEVSLNLAGKIKDIAQVRYNFNGRRGFNNIGENISYYSDLNFVKNFKNNFSLEAGKQENYYSTKYFEPSSSNSSFNSFFPTIYTKARIPMPKNKGSFELGHDIVSYISNDVPNNYNVMKFNYTFPEMKKILLSFGAGYRYSGADKGINYTASVGYRMKSGMVIGLGYQYNTSGGYMLDNMYIPTNARHSINLTLNNTYAVVDSGIKPVGYADASKGFVEVVAYLDKNNNGIYDEGDIGVENVPIKLSWMNDVLYTDKNGKIPIATADRGVYKVGLDNEKLQSNLSCNKNIKDTQLVMVNPKSKTNVEFKLVSSVGNIKGNLKIIDDFGRTMQMKDFIVVLDDVSDVEVAYSTVDKNGNFYFSGVSPGKYTLMLDESFLEANNLQPFEDKGKQEIDIPFVYKNFVDIEGKNIVYKCW